MRILSALLLTCLVSTGFWSALDRPLDAPDWRGRLRGVSYSPSRLYSASNVEQGATAAALRRDLQQIARFAARVRTYTVSGGQHAVPALARELGLTVSLGIWLGRDRAGNEAEIARALRTIHDAPQAIDRVFVGNEAVLRGDLTAREVAGYIRRVRAAITDRRIEVGTADVWGVWLANRELAAASDFVGIHVLPYWEGIAAEDAMEFIADRVARIHAAFPGKKVVIAEAGWPSDGRVRKASVPSPALQAYFLRHFLTLAERRNFDYYVIEAFDQPWKAESEGAVGAFWGMRDAEGRPKANLAGALTAFPSWSRDAAYAAAGILALGGVLLWAIPALAAPGYLLVAGVVGLVVTGALVIAQASSLQYAGWDTAVTAVFLVPALLFAAALLIAEAIEWGCSLWRRDRRPAMVTAPAEWPRVSIHVPIHNEPPAMVLDTLAALARLDYPDFEVIVIDNNTADPGLWRPVRERCRALGSRFRFVHVERLEGFKAGALNHALRITDPAATLVAVVDSDYQVDRAWLRTTVPAFGDPAVALVQAPQDYRDGAENLFKSLCYEEYATFFHVGMVERNEHNAIVQHGTMCVVRREALAAAGGWAEWCITEDTELGLRLLEAGYTASYVPVSLGRGLIPDTWQAFRTQRYRWVYGAMQILKRHARSLFTRRSHLTLAQRYHFVAGWLPWLADAFGLLFGALALVWTALVALDPARFDVPLTAYSAVAIALFVTKAAKTACLHRVRVGSRWPAALGASLTGLSLTCTVGYAVVAGLFTSDRPFMRTPKCEDAAAWTRVFRIARVELLLLAATLAAIAVSVRITGVEDPAQQAWVAALAVFAVPHASTVLVAILSAVPLGPLAAREPLLPGAFGSPDVDVAA